MIYIVNSSVFSMKNCVQIWLALDRLFYKNLVFIICNYVHMSMSLSLDGVDIFIGRQHQRYFHIYIAGSWYQWWLKWLKNFISRLIGTCMSLLSSRNASIYTPQGTYELNFNVLSRIVRAAVGHSITEEFYIERSQNA